jgi:hypothetical protein
MIYVCVYVGKEKCKQESLKQEINPDSSGNKTLWQLEPIGIGAGNTDANEFSFPAFVLKAVKVNLLQKVYLFFLYIAFI